MHRTRRLQGGAPALSTAAQLRNKAPQLRPDLRRRAAGQPQPQQPAATTCTVSAWSALQRSTDATGQPPTTGALDWDSWTKASAYNHPCCPDDSPSTSRRQAELDLIPIRHKRHASARKACHTRANHPETEAGGMCLAPDVAVRLQGPAGAAQEAREDAGRGRRQRLACRQQRKYRCIECLGWAVPEPEAVPLVGTTATARCTVQRRGNRIIPCRGRKRSEPPEHICAPQCRNMQGT